ncbi:ARS binding protein 2-domain-containing protein [Peziza echinospora]|nr:ARS binding protein 2-domain-containing protein [Peziza echinospora]
MSLVGYHDSSGESDDDDGALNRALQDSAGGQAEGDNGGDSSEDPLDGHREQSESNELQHNNNSTFPRQPQADVARISGSQAPDADHISLGGFNSASPASKQSVPAFIPTDRSLPSKDVTDETLDDAYVAFILYCNPSVPLDCDSAELRKAFRLPPKSDGKTFNVYELLQLIMKLEQKEIKTWTKLAIELGVERTPDQSAQKVQQYAVRLKRWMHAMHIDAFFEYCLGKAHSYYMQIPPLAPGGYLDEFRDGVPLEEDLALRALHPESRPKRGRRRTEDRNDDGSEREGAGGPAAKRQQMDPPTPSTADASSAVDPYHGGLFPHSAAPSSADADGLERYHMLHEAGTPVDPWSAPPGGGSSGQQFRWRAFSKEATTPNSAATPTLALETPTDEPMTPTVTTPMSAGPRSRPRRRHGPAVSSAWPSSGNPLTGKLRGRPPSNRSVRDGPFSTFPVNPSSKPAGPADAPGTGASGTPTSTPVATSHPQQFPPAPNTRPQVRPQGLHLQVPPRKPSTVTMATPIAPQANGNNALRADTATEALERAFAANLLQGINISLSLEDARKIAHRAIADLKPSRTQSQAAETALISSLNVLLGCDGSTADMFKGFRIQKVSAAGVVENLQKGQEATPGKYKLTWRLVLGTLKGEFTQFIVLGEGSSQSRGLLGLDEVDEDEDDEDGSFGRFSMSTPTNRLNGNRGPRGGDARNGGNANEFEWQAKYFEMEARLRETEQRLRQKEDDIAAIKRKVLNAVM